MTFSIGDAVLTFVIFVVVLVKFFLYFGFVSLTLFNIIFVWEAIKGFYRKATTGRYIWEEDEDIYTTSKDDNVEGSNDDQSAVCLSGSVAE